MRPTPSEPIREEDIESRSILRRSFLGRFAVAAGATVLFGSTVGCPSRGYNYTPCDSDTGDRADSDGFDRSDSDGADFCPSGNK